MKKIFSIILAMTLACALHGTELDKIVPLPESVEQFKGTLKMAGIAIKYDSSIDGKTAEAISRFASKLSMTSGRTSTVASSIGLREAAASGSVKGLLFIKDAGIASEGYEILVQRRYAVVKASDYNGFLYAMQTIRQMLPIDIYGTKANDSVKWTIPCCQIKDKPRFAYRGCHLDCARHFFTVETVKKYLDVMAMYKMNRFHWHLTEDQGWRIEIKAYPLLSQISCYRSGTQIGKDRDSNDGVRYGGFYSQDEIRDIVDYADKLGITIIPEIDLPGHMLAAMAAYPWLGCTGGPYDVWCRWGISKQVLCPGKETTFEFLENVLSEVAELFPGEYIHIGGDECPKDEWKKCPDCQKKIQELGLKDDDHGTAEQRLQNYVTARIQKFLMTKGKKIIGWDEILEGDLEEGATVMYWRGTRNNNGVKAAENGHDVIMTPNTYCYLDYYQSEDIENEPLAIGGNLPLEKVYSLDPYAGLSEGARKHILGVQCNLWTEYIATPEYLEYMLLPRMIAVSEVQWCTPGNRDIDRFKSALETHEFPILDELGYNYRKLR